MGFGKEEEDAEEDELSLDETREGLREDDRDRVPMAEAKKKSFAREIGEDGFDNNSRKKTHMTKRPGYRSGSGYSPRIVMLGPGPYHLYDINTYVYTITRLSKMLNTMCKRKHNFYMISHQTNAYKRKKKMKLSCTHF